MTLSLVPSSIDTNTDTTEEIEEAIIAFALARGNFSLAAERLRLPETRVRHLITQDPDLLAKHLRTQALVTTYATLAQVTDVIKTSIPDMEPYEQAKTLTTLLSVAQQMSASPPPAPAATNQFNTLIQNAPPEVVAAFEYLSKPKQVTAEQPDANTDQ